MAVLLRSSHHLHAQHMAVRSQRLKSLSLKSGLRKHDLHTITVTVRQLATDCSVSPLIFLRIPYHVGNSTACFARLVCTYSPGYFVQGSQGLTLPDASS